MAIKIIEIHAAESNGKLNEEWLVIENPGPNDFVAHGCKVTVGRNLKDRGRPIGTLDPGFVLHAGEKIRLVTGSAAKKAHGAPPEEKGCKNYHLFLGEPVLQNGAGTAVKLVLNQVEMAGATFDPKAKNGVAAAKED